MKGKEQLRWAHGQFREYFATGAVTGAALVFLFQGLFRGAWGQVIISGLVVGAVGFSTRSSIRYTRFNFGLESMDETEEGENFGRSLYWFTNTEVQALQRFAWAEGWWELWHQLKPYTDRTLPEGFAASLDRPDAPTPTPGPPTPTPDPSLPPTATPTPAPRATPTPTPIPARIDPVDRQIESPSASPDRTFKFGMAIKTPEDMQIRFDSWPDQYKTQITPDLVVMFAYDIPTVDWAGVVFINHIPSFSSMILDGEGKERGNSHINSEEAELAISALLADEELMREIVEKVRVIDAYTFGP